MKCVNCHGDRINDKEICEMCGCSNNKFKKSRVRIDKLTNFVKNHSNLIRLVLVLIMIASFGITYLSMEGIINPMFFLLDLFIVPFLIKFIAIGFVLSIAISLIKKGLVSFKLNKSEQIAEGKVVDIKDIKEIAEGPDFKDNFAPIIEYEVYGSKYRIIGNYEKEGIIVGQTMKVKYNPKKPTEALIVGNKSNTSSLWLGIFLFVICIIFLIF